MGVATGGRAAPPDVVFRADASAAIGVGHVMRCLALAREVRRRGLSVLFLGSVPEPLSARIRAADCACLPETDVLRYVRDASGDGARPPWVVLDGYDFPAAMHRSLRGAGARLLVIDDYAHLPTYDVDILLNQNAGAETLGYDTPPGTHKLLGPRYVLLGEAFRPFLQEPPVRRAEPGAALRILVSLGGGDSTVAYTRTFDGLRRVPLPIAVTVVIGPASSRADEIRSLAAALPGPSRVIVDSQDVAALMASADVAITAGGSTCLEAAFMALPVVAMKTAVNQAILIEGLQAAGTMLYLGEAAAVTPEQIAAAVTRLARDDNQRRAMASRGREVVDGAGAGRVSDAMISWTLTSKQCVLRPARAGDTEALWQLNNDPVVRRRAFTPDPIPFDSHERWFHDKLGSAASRIFVAYQADRLVAQVRYDRTDDGADIDFSVLPALHGEGLGSGMLAATWREACTQLGVPLVRGLVLTANPSSAGAFRRAGFTCVGERLYRDERCLVFERRAER